MAPLKLTVRTSPQTSFTLDFEDTETVEALAVAIFSLDPELGEELRLAHKGRPLKDDQELRAAGVQSGDVIAVAKKAPVPTPAALLAPAEALAPPLPSPCQDASSQALEAEVTKNIEEHSQLSCAPGQLQESGQACLDAGEGAGASAGTGGAPEPVSGQTSVPHDTPESPSCDGPAQDLHTQQQSRTDTQEMSAQALFEMARRFESGDGDAHPAMIAAFLQRAASRMQALENAVGEAGHALQLLNHFSAHALRSVGESVQGMPPHAAAQEEGTRSFLVKKGDADVQEAHRLAALHRPSAGCGSPQNSHAGGVLSSSSTPMTKADMDKARQARLDRLEQQQAEKKRANEEAAARSKAKEALFEKPLVGAPKPLGKF